MTMPGSNLYQIECIEDVVKNDIPGCQHQIKN